MNNKNWVAPTILSSLIFALIVGLILYGMNNRPLIDYNLDCDDFYSISSNYIITLQFRNRGQIDAPVFIYLRYNNITIDNESKKPYSFSGPDFIKYSYNLQKTEDYVWQNVIFHVDEDINSFSLNILIEKRMDSSFSGIFSRLFGELKSYYPINCEYVRGRYQFKLVK